MPASVQVRVRLDKKALDHELRGRTGSVGRTMAAFAGLATQDIKAVFRDRAGGAWWPITTDLTGGGVRGVNLRVHVRKSSPHRIRAVNAPMLYFAFEDGTFFIGSEVNHPGSSPPEHLVLLGVQQAGRRLVFTRAAPAVSYPT